MKKIKFITGTIATDATFINPSFYMLKTYHDHFGKHKNYQWLNPTFTISKPHDEYLKELLKEDFDILCAGIYCWNNIFLTKILEEVKIRRPECIIIVGGPDVTARNEPDWFVKNHFVDYVVYGDGEKCFSNLLDHFVEPVNLLTIPNLIWNHNGKKIANRHETMVREKEYMKISPWLHCKEYLKDDIENLYYELGKTSVVVLWERSRGCPYVCSYCDYSAGLHNKVFRRSYDYKEDIDLFESINPFIEINFIDANVGIVEEDLDIIKHILSKEKNRITKHFINLGIVSWTKINSEANKNKFSKIIDFVIDHNREENSRDRFKISQQDMNDEVLLNVDRPSMAWDILKKFYNEKRERAYPDEIYSCVELILGLPGQTKETWDFNIKECAEMYPLRIHLSPWQLVPYAPAQDKNYLEKYKIESVDAFTPLYNTGPIDEAILVNREKRNALMEEIQSGYGVSSIGQWSYLKMVTGSYSYSMRDLIYFQLKVNYYNKYMYNRNVISLLNESEEQIQKLTDLNYKLLMGDLEKYNFILFSVLDDSRYLK